MPGRPPPGRAGRIWLADRVATARRARDLLEHKQQLLRRERRRLVELASRTEREWRARVAEADTWSARALVAGGRDELARAAASVPPADVTITWTAQAGAAYPSAARVDLPAQAPALPPVPALLAAADACRRALPAAVEHAAASTALAHADAELAATARRLRAVRDRWLPRLEAELGALELRLDETEREEATRRRRAAGGRP